MLYYYDKKYEFAEFFNPENGFFMRTKVIKDGKETKNPPPMRSYPELIDVGIMGHCLSARKGVCRNSGVDCYQNALCNQKPNMSVENYKKIIDESMGKAFQIALGGAGDPNKHECFEDILKLTKSSNIIPNLTTSGYDITDNEIELMKKYCGAVAVSWYSRLVGNEESNAGTLRAINRLLEAKCKVNIHYVLSTDSVEEAIYRISNRMFPIGINAIVFLLYKPVGLGRQEKVLSLKNKGYIKFLELVSNAQTYKFGFDTCQTSALRKYCGSASEECLETCEAGKFSMYITSDMKAYPCSFLIENEQYVIDIKNTSILNAWNSDEFSDFRCNNSACYYEL